jgi:fructose-bisphosphate aldolase, class I
MPATDRVKQILSNYASDNPGTLTNLYRLLNTGTLAGTGKMVILPVDQGFEHGPARSFAPNAAGYDPEYHFQLAIDSGCNAYAAPLGFLEVGAAKFAGQIPLILKLNNSDSLAKVDPCSALTGTVDEAVRLGCVGIGYTIYPGSSLRNQQYQDLRDLTAEAKRKGLVVVVWSYARGALSKEGETGIDVIAYGAHIAAQLGAHIVKVKPPTAHIELPEARKAYDKAQIPVATLAERARHVVQSTFNGRRIVIFSGGEAKGTEDVLNEVRELAKGGAFGSIMGRNAFQRPRAEALKLLADVMNIYKTAGALAARRRPLAGQAGRACAAAPGAASASQRNQKETRMAEPVSFSAPGGAEIKGQIARPKGGAKAPTIVLIQEWWGVNDHIESLLDRLADAGFIALAPDLYHGKTTRDAAEAQQLMVALDTAQAVSEIGAAAAYLKALPEGNGKVGVVGFCLGGALAFATACHVPGLSAVSPFYGVPPAEKVDYKNVTAPILAHFAAKDGWAKPEGAAQIKAQIDAAGRAPMQLEIYDADHAFMNDTRPEVYSPDAAKLAWQRTVEFFHQHVG